MQETCIKMIEERAKNGLKMKAVKSGSYEVLKAMKYFCKGSITKRSQKIFESYIS